MHTGRSTCGKSWLFDPMDEETAFRRWLMLLPREFAAPGVVAPPFLEDILVRVYAGIGADAVEQRRAYAASWCLSSDVGHSVHPNYAAKHDPVVQPLLGSGPILKVNANQRYATDAVGAAAWATWCESAGIGSQEFVSNNTVPCGSTIGPITATRLGIRTVDVGIPILSMHSARELAGVSDLHDLTRVAEAFFTG